MVKFFQAWNTAVNGIELLNSLGASLCRLIGLSLSNSKLTKVLQFSSKEARVFEKKASASQKKVGAAEKEGNAKHTKKKGVINKI